MNMGENNTHGPPVQDALHEAVAALVWDPNKGRNPCIQASHAQLAGIVDGQCRMLQVDKECVEPAIGCQLDHLRIGDQPNAKGLNS